MDLNIVIDILVFAAVGGHYVSLPFLALFFVGFGYVGVLSLHQSS